ncbi:MAG: hypothetical protein M1817_000459 [Caeruleum heppii]|nr:MAG: hypothetical protein M1817_000459 [Caeruleum heppii]
MASAGRTAEVKTTGAIGSREAQENAQAKFDLGVAVALFNWPALTLAVQNQWGGPDSEGKREWFAGAITDMFSERPDTDMVDVETTLLQVMLDEFEVNVEDESAYEVAEQIVRLRTSTEKGDFAEVDTMHAKWLAKKGKSAVNFQKAADEEGLDTDWDSEDSKGDEDVDMDDGPPPLVEVKSKASAETDEDGFTKVVGKKRR